MRDSSATREARRMLLAPLLVLVLILAGCAEAADTNTMDAPPTSQEEADETPSDEHIEQGDQVVTTPSLRSQARSKAYRSTWASKASSVDAQDVSLELLHKPEPQTDRYTLMIYMVGSNLESSVGAATDDLNEMLDSGADFSQVNVIVYAGGSSRWNTDIPSNRNSVLDLSRPEGERIVAQTATSANMGASQTLTSFLDFCHEHYPAEHAALVLWDHGGGPLWGFGVDEQNGGDGLLLSELRDALRGSPWGQLDAPKLDWVGFDACLMGSLESAVLLRDYANWMVASEEVEPGAGWNYAFLATLSQTDDPKTITGAILDQYQAFYEARATTLQNPDVTLAACDLSQVGATVDALDDLVNVLDEDVSSGSYASLNRARHGAKAFGLSAVDTRAAAYDLVDLVDLAERLRDRHPREAESLIAAADSLIVRQVSNVGHTHGLSIYFPGENRELYESFDAFLQDSTQATRDASGTSDARGDADLTLLSDAYDRFVGDYTDAWLAASDVDWSLAEPQLTADGLRLTLTSEQADSFLSASYTVLDADSRGTFRVLTSDVDIPLATDGSVTAPSDPPLICAKTDLHKPVAGWFTQVEHGQDSATYVNRGLYLNPAGDFTGIDISLDPRVTVTVEVSDRDDSVTISSVTASDDGVGLGGRTTIDVTQYSSLIQTYFGGGDLPVAYDANNRALPWEEWNGDGFIYRPMPVEDGFGFVTMPASQTLKACAIQIVITDVNGNRHATEPMLVLDQDAPRTSTRTVTQQTELGTLTFTLDDTHAEVTRYEGKDWTVDIPREVEGLPVTAVGEDAFSSARFLDELVLPEGIEDIGAEAFAHSGLYELTLPSTLTHVAPAAFNNMPQLQRFVLSGTSPAVSVRDGVLFDAEGTRLLSYPNKHGSSYTVPEGTTELSYACFAQTEIQEVELPEGLLVIDRAAFLECPLLTTVNLPKSLERIGALAFGRATSNKLAEVPHIDLGPNVSSVGTRAFDGLNLRSIEVDPANPRFSSRGGCLLNAAGDVLVTAPVSPGKIVEVPEGVVAIDSMAFFSLDNDTEFILPASLESFEETALPYGLEQEEDGSYTMIYTCTIHAPKGSYAERFARDRGIAYDDICDRSLLSYDTHLVEQGELALEFRVYADRAVLVKVGEVAGAARAQELVIPSEVDGVPVTGINFGIASTLDDYQWPYNITSVVLPATLQTLGERGLSEFVSLERLSLADGCRQFKVVDDVLFSADGKTLYAYPTAREGAYVVPVGTTTIASYAFFDGLTFRSDQSGITEVTLADSVRTLGDNAFNNCDRLATVHFGKNLRSIGKECFQSCDSLVLDAPLPARVTEIGDRAFSNIASYEGLVLPKGIRSIGWGAFNGSYTAEMRKAVFPVTQSTLSIGSSLESLQKHAFSGLGIAAFEVNAHNNHYHAEGPFLLTADGRTLVAFACGYEGAATIPDGVREIDFSHFECAYGLTDLTIPPSVTYLASWGWLADDEPYASMRVHVQQGSPAARFAEKEGLAWIVE